MALQKIGLGGGCHWCTEAYFQSLRGVAKVEQGWIASTPPAASFSEAVLVHYDPEQIPLAVLIAIHLHTHASTKMHRFREKYRSAVYVLEKAIPAVQALIEAQQPAFRAPLITQALPFRAFRENTEDYQEYFRKNREGAFCTTYILPKLKMLETAYASYFKRI